MFTSYAFLFPCGSIIKIWGFNHKFIHYNWEMLVVFKLYCQKTQWHYGKYIKCCHVYLQCSYKLVLVHSLRKIYVEGVDLVADIPANMPAPYFRVHKFKSQLCSQFQFSYACRLCVPAGDGSSSWISATYEEEMIVPIVSDFGMTLTQLLKASGESTNRKTLFLCFLLCLTLPVKERRGETKRGEGRRMEARPC